MSKNPLSRRQFMQIGSGALVAGTVAKSVLQPRILSASSRPVAPSDTVRFASIGTGIRGCEHLQASLSVPGIQKQENFGTSTRGAMVALFSAPW